ncbi:MAG: hypothetical protein ABI743_06755 [bacterium]
MESAPTDRPLRILLISLALLYCWPNYAFFHDNLVYATQVMHSDWAQKCHPHHLGYGPTIWSLWTLIGHAINPLFLMVAISRIAAWGLAWQTSRWTREWEWPLPVQLLAVAIAGTAYGLWSYGTNGAVYAPAAFAVGMALWIVRDDCGRRAVNRAALWLWIAVMFHQLAIFGVVPIAYALHRHWVDGGYRLRGWWLSVGLLLLAPSALTYVVVYAAIANSFKIPAFINWLTRYSHQGKWWWWEQIPQGTSPFGYWISQVVGSHARLFWATPFGQLVDPTSHVPLLAAWQRLWTTPILAILAAVLGVIALLWILGTVRQLASAQSSLLLWWIAPFLLFTLFWDPLNAGYRLYYLAPLVLLILAPLATSGMRPRLPAALRVFTALLVFTLSLNLAYGWEPLSHPRVNPLYHDLDGLRELDPTMPLVVGGPGQPDWLEAAYLEVFLPNPLYSVTWEKPLRYEPKFQGGDPGTATIALSAALESGFRESAESDKQQPILIVPLSSDAPHWWCQAADWPPVTVAESGVYRFVLLEHAGH